ncbi:MAG: glycoside hydrolase family 2 [Alistipes sp.]|nr:glycoside hydrolase family 2 [Alistipes sp.]
MKKTLFITIAALTTTLFSAFGQGNFGLVFPQAESNLPKSKAPVPVCERKAFVLQPTHLKPTADGNLTLTDGWQMIEAATLVEKDITVWNTAVTDGWYNATVPGTVLTTLVEQQVYPDPYYGLNNLYIPETLCRQEWWYRISFPTPDIAEGELLSLLFNGINYKAEVWLNRKRLGNIAGAFTRAEFAINDCLNSGGDNILAVRIIPPHNPGIPHEQEFNSAGPNGGALCLDGPTFISSEGWDWIPGIRDRNIGIWQDVQIVRSGAVSLKDPQVVTDLPLPDTSKADITISTLVENRSKSAAKATIKGSIGDIKFAKQLTLAAGEKIEVEFTPEEFPQLTMQNPKLWWPNGYGEQNLYNLTLTVEQNGTKTEQKSVRFGVRELTYELMARNDSREHIRFRYSPTDISDNGKVLLNYRKRITPSNGKFGPTVIPALHKEMEQYVERLPDSENPYLVICVNGVKIFCKGGNWGMDDGMKRVSRERLEPYFRLHKEMNFTMIRNWTGESTEEEFYSLCDEYGLLVWNDFSISTGDYNLNPIDANLFLANAREIVRRYRNHPSIAIWCPRNEGYAPDYLEDGFQDIILNEDGTRHYHGNSRLMNLCQSGPWGYFDKYQEFATGKAEGFSTELGAPSMPTAETLRKFIAEEDLWPIGDVYYYHDLHQNIHGWQTYMQHINFLGDAPCQTIDEFCDRAQYLNYEIYRNMFESWNHKMWSHTSGLLLWMTHPAWPSVIWQTYTYDYETPAAYFASRKACEPTHIQWNATSKKLQVVNASREEYKQAIAFATIYDADGKAISKHRLSVDIAANCTTECSEITLPASAKGLTLVRLQLCDKKGKKISENDYWIDATNPTVYSSLDPIGTAAISWRVISKQTDATATTLTVEVRNKSKRIALNLKSNVRKADSNEAILPAYASDGYFHLLPGEKRTLTIEVPAEVAQPDMRVDFSGLNL